MTDTRASLDPVTHEDPAYARGWNDALAAQGPAQEERLDVGRVKQAITNIAVRHGVVKDPPPPTWSLMHTYGYTTAPATMDAEIAAEYRALGDETKEEGS